MIAQIGLGLGALWWTIVGVFLGKLFSPGRDENGTYYNMIDPISTSQAHSRQLVAIAIFVVLLLFAGLHVLLATKIKKSRLAVKATLALGAFYALLGLGSLICYIRLPNAIALLVYAVILLALTAMLGSTYKLLAQNP